MNPLDPRTPPRETADLRRQLAMFLDQPIRIDAEPGSMQLGNFKFGVYAFFDYDCEPIYVGQTNEKLRTRIRRHLTNQRTDAVAMKVLDPFEVNEIEVWPLPEYEGRPTADAEAKDHLNWLEADIFGHLIATSKFGAILNEKEPLYAGQRIFARPNSWRGSIVSGFVKELRGHPDTRLARRAETLSLLAKVISERQVQVGLRNTLLTQARRLAWLAERRLNELTALPADVPPQDDYE